MFRFTIRDLLWLMVVAGLAFGWWISLAKERAAWLSERAQIYAEWRKQRAEWLDVIGRINTTLLQSPTAERQELARTILGGTKLPDGKRPATLSDP